MFDYWYTLEWLFRLVHTNELKALCHYITIDSRVKGLETVQLTPN